MANSAGTKRSAAQAELSAPPEQSNAPNGSRLPRIYAPNASACGASRAIAHSVAAAATATTIPLTAAQLAFANSFADPITGQVKGTPILEADNEKWNVVIHTIQHANGQVLKPGGPKVALSKEEWTELFEALQYNDYASNHRSAILCFVAGQHQSGLMAPHRLKASLVQFMFNLACTEPGNIYGNAYLAAIGLLGHCYSAKKPSAAVKNVARPRPKNPSNRGKKKARVADAVADSARNEIATASGPAPAASSNMMSNRTAPTNNTTSRQQITGSATADGTQEPANKLSSKDEKTYADIKESYNRFRRRKLTSVNSRRNSKPKKLR